MAKLHAYRYVQVLYLHESSTCTSILNRLMHTRTCIDPECIVHGVGVVVNISQGPGAAVQACTAPTRSMYHAAREAMTELLQVGGTEGVLTRTRNMPRFTPRRSGSRAVRECVSHDYGAVRMCACQGTEQGTYREALLQTLLNG